MFKTIKNISLLNPIDFSNLNPWFIGYLSSLGVIFYGLNLCISVFRRIAMSINVNDNTVASKSYWNLAHSF